MSSFGESYAYSLNSDYRTVAEREETANANMRREHMLEQRYAFDQRQKSLNAFTSESRDFLLSESLYHIMKKCFPSTINESLLMRGRAIIDSFVQEETSTGLLNQFKTKTLFLSELANIVETTHKRVLHSCEGKDAPFKITNSDMKAFHNRIDNMDTDTITKEIVSRVTKAEEEFVRVFSNKNIPTDIQEYKIQGCFLDIILALNFASSKSEARRLAEQGGVHFENEKVYDLTLTPEHEGILKVGKRKFAKLIK